MDNHNGDQGGGVMSSKKNDVRYDKFIGGDGELDFEPLLKDAPRLEVKRASKKVPERKVPHRKR